MACWPLAESKGIFASTPSASSALEIKRHRFRLLRIGSLRTQTVRVDRICVRRGMVCVRGGGN